MSTGALTDLLDGLTGERSRERVLEYLACKFSETPIIPRTMVHVAVDVNTGHSPSRVRVLQWNILAQALATAEFALCAKEALSWPRRALYIVWELLRFDADVLCLEEVDRFSELNAMLVPLGYTGSFLPKVHSPCLDSADNSGPDGCAVFYRTARLDSVGQKSLNLYDADGQLTNQVALCHLFSLRNAQNAQPFCVAVTHLKAKSQFHQQRYVQGISLVSQIEQFCNDSGHVPVVLCGDMNAASNERVHQVIGSCPMAFQSAYRLLSANKEDEPPYTTWKIRIGQDNERREACQTIDYIYHSDGLQPVSLADLPSDLVIGPCRLPSVTYPSDHFSLVCDFDLLVQ